MIRRPSIQGLSEELRRVACGIADRLAHAGHRAWVVGGAVRDLALGRPVVEIDMTSDATPDDVERCFPRTVPLGRVFGSVLVQEQGLAIEHTTFRADGEYRDGRRPASVRFGSSPAEDAARRDFTCNALYLDPRTDEVLDPTGGLVDLEAGRLACVGVPADRFREDGVRLLRMARFAAGLGLMPTAAVLAGAHASQDALDGVSRERVLKELSRMFERPRADVALRLLVDCELLEHVFPGFRGLGVEPDARAAWYEGRVQWLAAARDPCGLELGLTTLLAPESGASEQRARELLLSLLPSRELSRRVEDAWRLFHEWGAAPAATRATRIRWMRRSGFEAALESARARPLGHDASASTKAWLDALQAEYTALGTAGLRPAPWIVPEDLARLGLAPGPAFGTWLREAETRQLDGEFASREVALGWLARVVQEGGNSSRSPRASG